MSLIFNGTDVKEVVYNGTVLDKVVYNGVTVCEKIVVVEGPPGLFYGGAMGGTHTSRVTRIDSNGAMVGIERDIGVVRTYLAGANVGGNGLFYAGNNSSNRNTVTRIDSNGAMVGSETSGGTARRDLAGANVGGNGLF